MAITIVSNLFFETKKVLHRPDSLRGGLVNLTIKALFSLVSPKTMLLFEVRSNMDLVFFSTTTIQAGPLRKLTHISGNIENPSDAKVYVQG